MKMRKLGTKGPEISVVGYGAWEIGGDAYGPNPDEKLIFKAIDAALDTGVNWIDTAEVYGKGNSETLVGKLLKGRRDQVLVATKVAPGPFGTGFKPEEINKAVRQSLERLKTDYIDLYQLHWTPDDDEWQVEETWGAMAGLIDEGLVRHIGVSNFNKETIERCLAVRHCDSLQPQYSMLHREGEELHEWCARKGIGVIVYGPLAYGLLSGTIDKDTVFDPGDWRSGKWPDQSYYKELFAPKQLDKHLGTIEELKIIAERKGTTMGQLALAWAFGRPGVTAAIAGSRSPEHNRENADAGDVTLAAYEFEEIENVLGGSGG